MGFWSWLGRFLRVGSKADIMTQRRLDLLKEYGTDDFAGFKGVRDKTVIRDLVAINLQFEQQKEDLLRMIAESGMIWDGHFLHENHDHSRYVFYFRRFVTAIERLEYLSKLILAMLQGRDVEFDGILCSDMAGSMLGSTLACSAIRGKTEQSPAESDRVPLLIARTDERGRPEQIINPPKGRSGFRVLLVDGTMDDTDVNLLELAALAKKQGYSVVGTVVFGMRYEKPRFPKELAPVFWVADFSGIERYGLGKCPLCKVKGKHPMPVKLLG